jgi:hypothetical protein
MYTFKAKKTGSSFSFRNVIKPHICFVSCTDDSCLVIPINASNGARGIFIIKGGITVDFNPAYWRRRPMFRPTFSRLRGNRFARDTF